MKISLIMGTLNREDLAIRAINSVLRQKYTDWEIIVIDQSDSASVTIPETDSRIKYIHIYEKGLSRARNIGLKIANGDIIGLMDDDAVYSVDALEKVVSWFEKDVDLTFLNGILVDISLVDSYSNRETIIRNVSYNNFMSGICLSATMFIRKTFLVNHPFDEKLGVGCRYGSGEESDIVAQMLEEKMRGIFTSEIVIFHRTGESKYEIDMSRHVKYCRGFGALCAKHIFLKKNKLFYYVYYKKNIRTTLGLLLSYLKNDEYLKKMYKTTLHSRREGFTEYKSIVLGEKK